MREMRRSDRAVTDVEEMERIVKSNKVMRVGMIEEGMPYVVPMNFGYEVKDGTYVFYFHCAKEGRKIDAWKKNPHVFIEMDGEHSLVEAELACGYGYRYVSFMGEGVVSFVEEEEEKIHALDELMLQQAGKKMPFSKAMVESVLVGKIEVKEYTAKARK